MIFRIPGVVVTTPVLSPRASVSVRNPTTAFRNSSGPESSRSTTRSAAVATAARASVTRRAPPESPGALNIMDPVRTPPSERMTAQ